MNYLYFQQNTNINLIFIILFTKFTQSIHESIFILTNLFMNILLSFKLCSLDNEA